MAVITDLYDDVRICTVPVYETYVCLRPELHICVFNSNGWGWLDG